ncbi:large subunit ribosomal protein L30 [Anaerobranca californiensis DSM 14826]|jgi:large subunit ribosomal protein L30|uniref:Large ribosomal subunit protein uL30 n=1 Tax=Anaerobranca californiensis DSM 14826 TaxID=1120989 RepID=A0A1M6MZN7_9FIRM|nr:50S ribosomal protein L30 [Anaerobranca californiensis]SHJ88939.1 large subunit ribosomal protein L30 [Anaerobranca californiensis DSM 14826]
MAKSLKIKLVRSLIGRSKDQRLVAQALGLKKLQQEVVQPDNPQIRGMVEKISHLLKVEEVN